MWLQFGLTYSSLLLLCNFTGCYKLKKKQVYDKACIEGGRKKLSTLSVRLSKKVDINFNKMFE